MPALGLPTAEQEITADASGYLKAIDEIMARNDKWLAGTRKIRDDLGDLSRSLDDFERNLPDFKINMMVDDHFNDAVGGIRDNIMKMAGDALKANADMEAAWQGHGRAVDEITVRYENARASISQMASDALDQNQNLADSFDNLHAKVVRLTDAHLELNRVVTGGGGGGGGGFLPGGGGGGGGGGGAVVPAGGGGGGADWTWTATVVPAMHDFQRALTAGASYVRAYGPGVGGSTGPTIWPAAQYSPFGPNQGGPGGAGVWPAFAAAGGAAHGGGSGGGFGAALGAAAGGIGGWMSGAGAALGGVTGGGGPSAFETSQVVTGFVRRWYPAAHWAMMLTNEMLATVGPAVVAAGMGALVGMQSVEQVAPRVGAIFKSAESIGSTMGQTAGQFMGLKTGLLQNAQNMATGSAVELLGAGVNIMKAGAGGPFVQLGSNTVSMVDRFAATLTQDFQKGGLGKQLGNIVGGGTGYLQQFGDVLANLGRTFLNVAPNLPGVGGDILSTLSGVTGGLARGSGFLGGMLGPILAGEAGLRYGPAIVGMGARTLGRIGGIPGLGFLGEAPRVAGAADVTAGLAGAEGDIIAGTGLAGALGGMGAPQIGMAAAAAYYLNKAYTYKTPQEVSANQLVSQIGQMGFQAGFPAAIAAMQGFAGTPPGGSLIAGSSLGNIGGGAAAFSRGLDPTHLNLSTAWGGAVRFGHGLLQMGQQIMGGGTAVDPTPYDVAQQAIQNLSQTMVNSLGSGQQVRALWKGLTGESIGMGKAFDVATMAQLQLGSSFEKNGKLTSQARTMIANFQAGYAPMNMNSGMMGAAVGAQTAMSGLQHTQVGSVNAAYDQLMQLVTGGGAGSASIFGMLGGTPTTHRVGGLSFAAPPAIKAMASALTSFTSASGAGAWNTFANPQTGMMSALQGQLDWLRNAQVMGALGPGDTTGMAGFLISQFLPVARKSPGALSALSMAAQQFGGPSFMPGTSAGGMFKGLSGWAQQFGTGSGGYNKMMNLAMQHLGNIPLDAQQFVQQIGSNVGGLPAGVQAYGANLQTAFMNSMGGPGGGFNLQALERYGKYMAGIGIPKTGAIDMAKYAAQIAGAGPHTQALVASQLGNLYAKLKIQVDTSAAKAAIANLTHVSNQPKVTVKAEVAAAVAAINAIKGKDIPVNVKEQGAAAVEAAINSIHGKNVTVTITTINRMITQAVGAGIIGHPGGVLAATMAGGPANMRITGHAAGGLVGGSGSGDHVPALLEPGEAIVPRFLVPLVAPILKSHHVPGFQSGGIAGFFPHMLGFPDPTIQGKSGQFAFTLIDGITKALNAAGAKKIADALITKIGQEVTLAKNVSSAAMQGQGFGNSGIFGNMDVTPGTGNGTVMEQMQSYLSSVQSFTKDLGTLRKEHLNKNIISQLVGAGPVQGDALAQSILNDYGGVKGVNQVWGQLGHATKGLGAQAAMAQYGGMLAPNLKSGSFSSNNVTININAGNASGGLGLTATQIKSIVEQVQAALLKQAKRNRQTGVALRNKKA